VEANQSSQAPGASQAASAELRRWEEAARMAGAAVWFHDGTSGKTRADGFLRLLGRDPASFGNAPARFLDLLSEEYRHQVCELIEEALATGNLPAHLELPFEAAGHTRWFRICVQREGPPDRGKVSLYGVALDVTEERQQRAALRSAKARAEEANRAKSEFIAMMSHEIRTPLTSIVGFPEILLLDELTSEQREQIETIREAGKALLVLIDDILDIARVEAGLLALRPVRLHMRRFFSRLECLFQVRSHNRGLQLRALVDDSVPPELTIDEGRLRQILYNLVSNALKFTARGSVTIRSCYRPAARPGDDSDGETPAPHGGLLEVTVTDTGAGIPQAIVRHLFRPCSDDEFQTSRRPGGGSGLGLAISKRLVDLLGGAIQLTANSPSGASIRFHLPCEVPPAAATPPAAHQAPLSQTAASLPARTLIIEDEAASRNLLAGMLQALGYKPCLATCEADAPGEIDREQPDIIFLEAEPCRPVPGTLARRIATLHDSLPASARPAIILLSADVPRRQPLKLGEVGAHYLLFKPYTLASLSQAVRAVLENPNGPGHR